ncbi:MAG: bifunctional demethylmenaquinone methyltransferase/2-methoxy-6-polyprenyl-1,4-benzoquinol methylase UbiE [Chitinophagaceae bacterium]
MTRAKTSQPILPFRDSKLSKKAQVEQMFDHIAFRYDLLNHVLSLGIDRIWRKKAISFLRTIQPKTLLDVATGTGDLALTAFQMLHPEKITGIDISEKMLEIGRKKISGLGLDQKIFLQQGDSETISFPDHSFDAVTVGFGIRNFENLEKGLQEMLRVLKPGGLLVILEFSSPQVFPVRQLFNFYFHILTPAIGRWVAHHREAYSYLPHSVEVFPQGAEMVNILQKTGYQSVVCNTLTFGISSIYCASKS